MGAKASLAGAVLLAALLVAPAGAAAAREVGADGNPFTGGLGYTPSTLLVPVGERVNWRNTDPVVPHTATEKHGLWDLGGSYGGTPANPSGFGPGEVVGRTFEAGTHRYYCRVHGADAQSGTVAVAPRVAIQGVRVKVKRKVRKRKAKRRRAKRKGRARRRSRAERRARAKRRRARERRRRARRRKRRGTKLVPHVVITWATEGPAAGQGFDVQYRQSSGSWKTLRTSTRERTGRFAAGRAGTTWHVRARLTGGPGRATDWSPIATISR